MATQAPARPAVVGNIFDRLLTLSQDALEAFEAGDMERLGEILARRADMIAEEVTAEETTADRLASALRLQEADTRLQLALTAGRDEVEQHLEAMESGETARSAYGPRNRAKGQLDVVR